MYAPPRRVALAPLGVVAGCLCFLRLCLAILTQRHNFHLISFFANFPLLCDCVLGGRRKGAGRTELILLFGPVVLSTARKLCVCAMHVYLLLLSFVSSARFL